MPSDTQPIGASAPSSPSKDGFVHLHLHTEYSLLDGCNRIDRLVNRVKELGMDAVAVTDHGNLHGAINFYKAARVAGIKPILGVEAYIAPGDRHDRTYTGVADGGFHLVLLAENLTGWNNLLYLCSEAYLTGFYYKPRIDRELLQTHGQGLIAINGHLGSELAHHLVNYETTKDPAHWQKANDVCDWHEQTFTDDGTGPRFYIELQHHIVEQNVINPHLIRLAQERNLPLVCDNDSHFLKEENHDAHDTLICISMGKVKNDPDRMRYPEDLYVKSPQQMRALFEKHYADAGTQALNNTVAIADRCNVELPMDENYAPVVHVNIPDDLPAHDDPIYNGDLTAWFKDYCSRIELEPFDSTDESADEEKIKQDCDRALLLLAEAGTIWRYGPQSDDEEATTRRARLERELKILADKNISAYFLIVWDFVSWGRRQGIPSLARGSGVGTMVGYVLGLSNACPVHYGLLFERFTDPDRTEYPDIDIDICQNGRARVIDYVRHKYGHVAQIITFGTLKARAAVRDVGRVLELPLPDTDKLAKLIPEGPGVTLDSALKDEPDLKQLYNEDELVKRVIDTAKVIEGQARHASVHAAGVIVATQPLHTIVPLYKQSGAAAHEVVTQWDGPTCENLGLLKMDFLGLRTLTIIERARELITKTLPDKAIWEAVSPPAAPSSSPSSPPTPPKACGLKPEASSPHPLDLERLTYDDPAVFKLFQRGDTTGIFQFESGGMRRLLVEMKPDRLEDLIAANALFRPGPMDLIPDYNRRKHGEDKVPSVHPIVDKFTAETYGVMVYQEQVMQIVHELGDIPLRAAYSLIKAISKKKKDVIDANRPKFIDGAGEKGLAKQEAEELFDLILKFAGYGFNKSHSTGYAIVAYQTAYLKTYFPAHYMAAFLTFESQAQKIADWIPYIEDCKRTRFTNGQIGIEVRPPDINLSQADFTVVYEKDEQKTASRGHIRFGLKAIKGAGTKAIEAIINERDGTPTPASSPSHPISPAPVGGAGEMGDSESPEGVPPTPPTACDLSPKAFPTPFPSLFEFCERVPSTAVNKSTIESLIKCGAFDAVHGRDKRAAMVGTIERAVNAGQRAAADRAAGQSSLFGGPSDTPEEQPDLPLEPVPAWSETETLKQEKETVGFYISSHPLEHWRAWTNAFTTATAAQLKDKPQDDRAIVAAIIQSKRVIVVRNGRSAGQKMAILTIEDTSGTCEAVLFTDCYAKYNHLLEGDDPLFVVGRLDHSRGDAQIIVDQLAPINGVPLEKGRLRFTIKEERLNGSGPTVLKQLAQIVADHQSKPTPKSAKPLAQGTSGAVPFELIVETKDAYYRLQPEKGYPITLDPTLATQTTTLLGKDSLRLIGGKTIEMPNRRQPTNRS